MIAVTQTENSLALTAVQGKRIQASLDAATVHLEQARRDLSKCEITLPLAARCASKSVEVNQYVALGEQLGTFLALEATEVVAMVETRKMPWLFPMRLKSSEKLDLTRIDFEEVRKQIRIPAEVSWRLGDRRLVWYGRVTRIGSSLDSSTQTVPITIEVPDSYRDVRPGIRPPLIPDTFCKVIAYGATLSDVVVIPREALRDDRIYLLRENKPETASGEVKVPDGNVAVAREGAKQVKQGRLHVVSVDVVALEEDVAVIKESGALIQQGEALVKQGESLIQKGGTSIEEGGALVKEGQALVELGRQTVHKGDLVVLTDLFPAPEGMPLRGKLAENPVKPRTTIDVPESIFESESAQTPAAEEPADAPAEKLPTADPAPESKL